MIKVLIADDSRAFRAILRTILGRAPDIEIIGEAADGDEAVTQVMALRPDVVTMDVRMPGKDGLTAIDEIMRQRPTPIVVVSSEAGAGADKQEVSFKALGFGAVEVLGKPRADVPGRFEKEAEEIRMAVRAVAGLQLVTRHRRPSVAARPPPGPGLPGVPAAPREPLPPPGSAAAITLLPATAPRVIGIAASTGGPAALAKIFRDLPSGYPIPILVVQHIAEGFEAGLVHWLSAETGLRVRIPDDGDALKPGVAYVAPSGVHMGASGGFVRFVPGEPVRGFKPSGTALFQSLAREYGPSAAGLVLSGMGDDGADGLKVLRDRGAWTAAQGPQSSVVFGMPRVALEKGGAAVQLELDEIAPALVKLAKG
ncbi:MAG: chemotaxis-specific protein-glutamate methyltransferase CheB [Anaeromyxobacter sp.]